MKVKNYDITIINTNNKTTEGANIYKYIIWNVKGQQTNAGEIEATNIAEAKQKILEYTF